MNDCRGAVEAAFRRIHVRLSENCSNIFQAEPEGGNRRRIHLHAHGRFLISLNRDKADAGDFANFLREQRVGEIVHAIQGQTIGRNRQRKDRRVGRIDLVVFRRVRQILRQKSAGDIDRGLHVLRRDVDGRSRTNCKVIVDVPNELVEFIDANPLICPNCRSSGVVIDETITSALAPG